MRISFCFSYFNRSALFTLMFQRGGLRAEKGRKKRKESRGDKGQDWEESPSSQISSQLGPLLATKCLLGHWRRREEDKGGERRKGKKEIEKKKRKNLEGGKRNVEFTCIKPLLCPMNKT